ncbi:chorion-specific transcription factor GCM [Paragonimus westermani]|uniref:Chorion-specific transcription factor GCM n=1 Tax=Paragonimus westermani TaxID=34504 RepID=A0A5J4NJ69_9TREM|nr:chorion-specific transcription factor GCM [Paragonimus westermani]
MLGASAPLADSSFGMAASSSTTCWNWETSDVQPVVIGFDPTSPIPAYANSVLVKPASPSSEIPAFVDHANEVRVHDFPNRTATASTPTIPLPSLVDEPRAATRNCHEPRGYAHRSLDVSSSNTHYELPIHEIPYTSYTPALSSTSYCLPASAFPTTNPVPASPHAFKPIVLPQITNGHVKRTEVVSRTELCHLGRYTLPSITSTYEKGIKSEHAEVKRETHQWDIKDVKLPRPTFFDAYELWPTGHCRRVYTQSCERARRHQSGWAMRNTNNHNPQVLKKSCLGVLECSAGCTVQGKRLSLRPAICDKARKKQTSRACITPGCSGRLLLRNCRGHSGYPVTHFWRFANGAVYFEAKGEHDHNRPSLKTFGLAEALSSLDVDLAALGRATMVRRSNNQLVHKQTPRLLDKPGVEGEQHAVDKPYTTSRFNVNAYVSDLQTASDAYMTVDETHDTSASKLPKIGKKKGANLLDLFAESPDVVTMLSKRSRRARRSKLPAAADSLLQRNFRHTDMLNTTVDSEHFPTETLSVQMFLPSNLSPGQPGKHTLLQSSVRLDSAENIPINTTTTTDYLPSTTSYPETRWTTPDLQMLALPHSNLTDSISTESQVHHSLANTDHSHQLTCFPSTYSGYFAEQQMEQTAYTRVDQSAYLDLSTVASEMCSSPVSFRSPRWSSSTSSLSECSSRTFHTPTHTMAQINNRVVAHGLEHSATYGPDVYCQPPSLYLQPYRSQGYLGLCPAYDPGISVNWLCESTQAVLSEPTFHEHVPIENDRQLLPKQEFDSNLRMDLPQSTIAEDLKVPEIRTNLACQPGSNWLLETEGFASYLQNTAEQLPVSWMTTEASVHGLKDDHVGSSSSTSVEKGYLAEPNLETFGGYVKACVNAQVTPSYCAADLDVCQFGPSKVNQFKWSDTSAFSAPMNPTVQDLGEGLFETPFEQTSTHESSESKPVNHISMADLVSMSYATLWSSNDTTEQGYVSFNYPSAHQSFITQDYCRSVDCNDYPTTNFVFDAISNPTDIPKARSPPVEPFTWPTAETTDHTVCAAVMDTV